ncbi:hypothetical protein JW859_13380 [bacterium]|nr:hypothetical protein [bacterium]
MKREIIKAKYWWRCCCDSAFGWGAAWCRDGFLLARPDYEARARERLIVLLDGFKRLGLCTEPEYAAFAKSVASEQLSHLPVLDKPGLQKLFPRLQENYKHRADVYPNATGGSTGEPVSYLRSKLQDNAGGGASYEMFKLLGWRPGMLRVSLWGSERDIGRAEKRKGWWKSLLDDTTLVGAYAPDEEVFRRFVDTIEARPGCAVYGFTSLLAECARVMVKNGWQLAPGAVGTAWVGAEAVSDAQREVFYRAFGVRLRDHYGSRECSTIAAECDHRTRHINPRYLVEAVDHATRRVLPAGEVGSLLVTDLFNEVTPLIRYEIGDLGSVDWGDCPCGRSGFCLTELTGRTAGLFELESGRKVSALFFNHLLKEFPTVLQFQVLRDGLAEFRVAYTGEALSADEQARLESVVSHLLEGARVTAVYMEQLDRSASGKLMQYRDLRDEAEG